MRRGGSLLKEPSAPTICAFCWHRLGAIGPPSLVQRRFIQSSDSRSKPPAEGTAVRESEEYESPPPVQPQTPAAPWRSGPGMGMGFGKATFGGSKIPGIGTSATFGRPAPGIPMKSTIPDPPKPESPNKFSPEEELRMSQQRKVEIHSGPGPETNRAFRPIPRSQEERLEIARIAAKRQETMNIHAMNKQHTQPDAPLRYFEKDESSIRSQVSSQIINDSTEPITTSEITSESSENASNWAQLRKKIEEKRHSPPPQQVQDPISEAQAKREQEASSGTYTPLRNIIPSERGRFTEVPRADMWSRPNNYDKSKSMTPISQTTPTNNYQRPQNSPQSTFISNSYPTTNPGSTRPPQPAPSARAMLKPLGSFGTFGSPSFGAGFGKIGGSGFKIPGLTTPSPLVEPEKSHEVQNVVEEPEKGHEVENSVEEPAQEHVAFSPLATEPEESDVREQVINQFSSPDELAVRHRKLSERWGAVDDTALKEKDPNYRDHALPKKAHSKVAKKAARRQREMSMDRDDEVRDLTAERAELKRQRKREKAAKKAAAPTPIILPEFISVSNLAVALKVKLENFLEKMEELGFEGVNHDHILNAENAGLIAMEYNFEAIIERGESEDLKARPPAEDPSILPQRAPVVTIMGHVDHGKTTILDYLRKSSVAASEHGGITQHIGAFSVAMSSGKTITFLDTPGHEAFLSMRQRGANVTDIVILVVAADDSVKPQTIEAINHAKAAKVPIIVAINKIDRPEIDIERVKQDLARHGVEIEDFGGDTQVVCVSGKTGQGMDDLEEAAVTLSEIIDMRAETDGPAEGYVIEASIKPMGKVATVLVRRGTMRPGDFIVAGKTWARIRCLRNEAGVEIEEAGPGIPVEIDGWREQPIAGDEVLQAPDEAKAKSVIEFRLEKEERDKMAEDMEAINENRKIEHDKREREKAEKEAALGGEENQVQDTAAPSKDPAGPKPVYFVVKGDVSGSVEAVIDQLNSTSTKEVEAIVLRSGVGKLSESDIEHAATAKGYVINFNTEVEPSIAQFAAKNKVTILDNNIIYRLMDDVRAEMSKSLPPLVTQRVLGEAVVAQIFDINIKGRKFRSIAGCKVRNGTVARDARYRVLRDGEKVFDGKLDSLKNVKKDVPEMRKSGECGMGFIGWSDFQVGDQIQAYEVTEEKRYL
ncbi:d6334ddd-2804-43a6-b228-241ffe28f643 [Sclerotinia trifoliorum]|uniref:Translation initiation factor IF-2, mitochondrial n=1 Tax=Sclerotinia trifoliorum TaxID=28548 RepID=A0A8H2W694_9HELO|nr:d6334ddd-2804-43a6-b228-241ffe28f643 [Sclerotinia trifoliorum]